MLLTLLLYSALGGAFFLLTFDLVQVHGYSATLAGAVFLPFTVIMGLLSRWSGGLLDRVGHPNLALLLDIGHCLISREEPADVVRRAGSRLGYVHLDDNDGQGDLHWPLLTGRLTRDGLRELGAALRSVGYRGPLSLELNPANADPVAALREGKGLLETVV